MSKKDDNDDNIFWLKYGQSEGKYRVALLIEKIKNELEKEGKRLRLRLSLLLAIMLLLIAFPIPMESVLSYLKTDKKLIYTMFIFSIFAFYRVSHIYNQCNSEYMEWKKDFMSRQNQLLIGEMIDNSGIEDIIKYFGLEPEKNTTQKQTFSADKPNEDKSERSILKILKSLL